MSFRVTSRAAIAALTVFGATSMALSVPFNPSVAQRPAVASTTRGESASDRFDRIQRRYRNALSFRLHFSQTVNNPLTGSTSKAEGTLLRKKPNLFSLSFTEPATGDRVVCDGKAVWVYLPSSAPNQVIKMPVTNEGTAMVDPVGHILTAPANHYKVADAGKSVVAGQAVRGIQLTSNATDALFTKATVWADNDGTVLRIETNEASGVERQVTITGQALNVSIPLGTFTFTPPRNVRVVSQGASLGG